MSSLPNESAHAAALEVASLVLEPLARLLLTQGVKYPAMQELLKATLVNVASKTIAQAPTPNPTQDQAGVRAPAPQRYQSRVSVATGLRRPEIKRLLDEPRLAPRAGRSIISDVFGRWTSQRRYRDKRGRIMPLARHASEGGALSFESLVWSIRRDVHPRAVLEDMLRLGMVKEDSQTRIKLNQVAFVPKQDVLQMLHFLGVNVSEHLASAVHNALGRSPDFLEQCVLVEGISPEGAQAVEQAARQQWARIYREMGDVMNQELERDTQLNRPGSEQLRLGMYTHAKSWERELRDVMFKKTYSDKDSFS